MARKDGKPGSYFAKQLRASMGLARNVVILSAAKDLIHERGVLIITG